MGADFVITPATINGDAVTPVKAGILNSAGCRIKPGMTTVDGFACRRNKPQEDVNAAE